MHVINAHPYVSAGLVFGLGILGTLVVNISSAVVLGIMIQRRCF